VDRYIEGITTESSMRLPRPVPLLLVSSLVACGSAEDERLPTPPTPPPVVESSIVWMPEAPWETFVASYQVVRGPADFEPPSTMLLEGPDGMLDLTAVRHTETHWEFVPPHWLAPGEYRVIAAFGQELDPQPITEVLPWHDAPLPLPGDAFVLDLSDAMLLEPFGLEALLKDNLPGDVWVEFLEPEAPDERPFRFVVHGDSGTCILHESHAIETADGTLLEATPVLDFAVGDAFGRLYDLELELAFGDDGARTRAAQVVADTAAIDPVLAPNWPGATCELLGAFGVACRACPDGTSESCVALNARGIEALAAEPPWAPDAAIGWCGGPSEPLLDLEPIECGCTTSGPWAAWIAVLVLPFLRRRR
jgi:MYXO-CTERM domain-containing protein